MVPKLLVTVCIYLKLLYVKLSLISDRAIWSFSFILATKVLVAFNVHHNGSRCCTSTYLSFHFSKESQKSLQRRSFGSKFLNGIRFSFLNPLNNLTPCGHVVKFLPTLQRSYSKMCILSHTEDYVVFSWWLSRPYGNLIIIFFHISHQNFKHISN